MSSNWRPGVIIKIDESLITKRKNHRGNTVQQKWVFVGVDPATNIDS